MISSWPHRLPITPWRYKVPYSDVTLIFWYYGEMDTDAGRAASQVLQNAIRGSMNPFRPQTPVPPWISEVVSEGDDNRRVRLEVGPVTDRRDPEKTLTYGLWTSALTGVKAFMEHYPSLSFMFEIQVTEFDDKDGKEKSCLVGVGGLRVLLRSLHKTLQSGELRGKQTRIKG